MFYWLLAAIFCILCFCFCIYCVDHHWRRKFGTLLSITRQTEKTVESAVMNWKKQMGLAEAYRRRLIELELLNEELEGTKTLRMARLKVNRLRAENTKLKQERNGD